LVKSELVQRRSSRAIHICINATSRIIVDAILGEIADALARYDRVELCGFESGARRARDATC
jgi:nucleoid DNA-binding protein